MLCRIHDFGFCKATDGILTKASSYFVHIIATLSCLSCHIRVPATHSSDAHYFNIYALLLAVPLEIHIKLNVALPSWYLLFLKISSPCFVSLGQFPWSLQMFLLLSISGENYTYEFKAYTSQGNEGTKKTPASGRGAPGVLLLHQPFLSLHQVSLHPPNSKSSFTFRQKRAIFCYNLFLSQW